jgi:hypothetical protein
MGIPIIGRFLPKKNKAVKETLIGDFAEHLMSYGFNPIDSRKYADKFWSDDKIKKLEQVYKS